MHGKNRLLALFAAVLAISVAFAEVIFVVFYPVKMRVQIKKECKARCLDEPLVYAVISCESGFNAVARSNKGAIGLMQLMPETAEWCAQMTGKSFSVEMLCNAEYNLSLGCYYLSYLIEKFGSVKWAVAAFNAGEGNVKKWLETDGIIRFPETEMYVRRVMRAIKIYKYLLKRC